MKWSNEAGHQLQYMIDNIQSLSDQAYKSLSKKAKEDLALAHKKGDLDPYTDLFFAYQPNRPQDADNIRLLQSFELAKTHLTTAHTDLDEGPRPPLALNKSREA